MMERQQVIPLVGHSWAHCLDTIEPRLNPNLRSAISGSVPLKTDGRKLVIGVYGNFSRDLLNRQGSREEIMAKLPLMESHKVELEFIALPEPAEGGKAMASATPPDSFNSSEDRDDRPTKNSGSVSPLNPRYTFKTFVRGGSNSLASAAAIAVAEQPAKAYNPLFIYGGVGLGKTHLMHAIGHTILQRNPHAKIAYMSAERFTNEMIDSISDAKMNRFRRSYRTVDILLVDDIQFLANKERTQEEFFHTFNELHGANKQIVISSDRTPRQIPTLEDRLRSRFEWGMIADIQPPDFETRVAILRKKAEQCNCPLSNEVSHLLAERVPSNIRELEGALTRLMAFSSLQQRPITVDLATEALRGILPDPSLRVISIGSIQKAVCEYFSISMNELNGKRRDQKVVKPRQVAMFLCKELTGASYPEIGSEFGNRDHTTVMHSCRKIDANIEDPYFRTSLENIRNMLSGVGR
jgi:chromosomal replication initiator protein